MKDFLVLKVFCPYQTHHIQHPPSSFQFPQRELQIAKRSCLGFLSENGYIMMKAMMWYIVTYVLQHY